MSVRVLTGLVAAVLVCGPLLSSAAEPPYRVLAADKGRVSLVAADGKVEWSYDNKAEAHDLQLLENGNVLLPLSSTEIAEVTREKQIVWKYKAEPKAGHTGRVEVHAFQRLANGLTMVAESGNGRIVEVDAAGKIIHTIPLTLDHPHPHRDTRMVRPLEHGGYLVCHEGDGKLREYDRDGKVLWTYVMNLGGRPRTNGHGPEGHGVEVYGAVRLKNGNTLIGGGNNNRVLEVDKEGKLVWSLDQNELPGVTLAWVTTIHALPNGNIIVGNCHAGPENPQLFEVTRDKQVVWQFRNFEVFGNGLAASHVLGLGPDVIR